VRGPFVAAIRKTVAAAAAGARSSADARTPMAPIPAGAHLPHPQVSPLPDLASSSLPPMPPRGRGPEGAASVCGYTGTLRANRQGTSVARPARRMRRVCTDTPVVHYEPTVSERVVHYEPTVSERVSDPEFRSIRRTREGGGEHGGQRRGRVRGRGGVSERGGHGQRCQRRRHGRRRRATPPR